MYKILNCKKCKLKYYDFVLPYNIIIEKYNISNSNLIISNIKHKLNDGGMHGAIKNYSYTCCDKELLIMLDADQLYPNLMVKYNLLSRSIQNKEIYKCILNKSIELKLQEKYEEREKYKKFCNIVYGEMGNKNSILYDNLNRIYVCKLGQYVMLDLIEKIEDICKLIQTNTDGILILIQRKDFEKLDDIVYEWENRTGLHMTFKYYKKVIQKDVNNYILLDYYNNIIKKGFKNDLEIVNDAIINCLIYKTPIETTINTCYNSNKFVRKLKLTDKFDYILHNDNKYTCKTINVYASNDIKDTAIYKVRGNNKYKFADTSKNCTTNFLKIDKKWYINLAKERMIQYVNTNTL